MNYTIEIKMSWRSIADFDLYTRADGEACFFGNKNVGSLTLNHDNHPLCDEKELGPEIITISGNQNGTFKVWWNKFSEKCGGGAGATPPTFTLTISTTTKLLVTYDGTEIVCESNQTEVEIDPPTRAGFGSQENFTDGTTLNVVELSTEPLDNGWWVTVTRYFNCDNPESYEMELTSVVSGKDTDDTPSTQWRELDPPTIDNLPGELEKRQKKWGLGPVFISDPYKELNPPTIDDVISRISDGPTVDEDFCKWGYRATIKRSFNCDKPEEYTMEVVNYKKAWLIEEIEALSLWSETDPSENGVCKTWVVDNVFCDKDSDPNDVTAYQIPTPLPTVDFKTFCPVTDGWWVDCSLVFECDPEDGRYTLQTVSERGNRDDRSEGAMTWISSQAVQGKQKTWWLGPIFVEDPETEVQLGGMSEVETRQLLGLPEYPYVNVDVFCESETSVSSESSNIQGYWGNFEYVYNCPPVQSKLKIIYSEGYKHDKEPSENVWIISGDIPNTSMTWTLGPMFMEKSDWSVPGSPSSWGVPYPYPQPPEGFCETSTSSDNSSISSISSDNSSTSCSSTSSDDNGWWGSFLYVYDCSKADEENDNLRYALYFNFIPGSRHEPALTEATRWVLTKYVQALRMEWSLRPVFLENDGVVDPNVVSSWSLPTYPTAPDEFCLISSESSPSSDSSFSSPSSPSAPSSDISSLSFSSSSNDLGWWTEFYYTYTCDNEGYKLTTHQWPGTRHAYTQDATHWNYHEVEEGQYMTWKIGPVFYEDPDGWGYEEAKNPYNYDFASLTWPTPWDDFCPNSASSSSSVSSKSSSSSSSSTSSSSSSSNSSSSSSSSSSELLVWWVWYTCTFTCPSPRSPHWDKELDGPTGGIFDTSFYGSPLFALNYWIDLNKMVSGPPNAFTQSKIWREVGVNDYFDDWELVHLKQCVWEIGPLLYDQSGDHWVEQKDFLEKTYFPFYEGPDTLPRPPVDFCLVSSTSSCLDEIKYCSNEMNDYVYQYKAILSQSFWDGTFWRPILKLCYWSPVQKKWIVVRQCDKPDDFDLPDGIKSPRVLSPEATAIEGLDEIVKPNVVQKEIKNDISPKSYVNFVMGEGGAKITVSNTPPNAPKEGDIWMDTSPIVFSNNYTGLIAGDRLDKIRVSNNSNIFEEYEDNKTILAIKKSSH